jgi:hypothetical protein
LNDNVSTIKKNAGTVLDAKMEVGLEMKEEKLIFLFMFAYRSLVTPLKIWQSYVTDRKYAEHSVQDVISFISSDSLPKTLDVKIIYNYTLTCCFISV